MHSLSTFNFQLFFTPFSPLVGGRAIEDIQWFRRLASGEDFLSSVPLLIRRKMLTVIEIYRMEVACWFTIYCTWRLFVDGHKIDVIALS
jgi:hypothetical protein